jgi:lysophospholipase L1-like esterase
MHGKETLEPTVPDSEIVRRVLAGETELFDIALVLCSLTPISDYTERKQSTQRPPADIRTINDWLQKYAAQINAVYADYFPALADSSGFLKGGLSSDGLHSNDKGYAIMAPIAQSAIEKARGLPSSAAH